MAKPILDDELWALIEPHLPTAQTPAFPLPRPQTDRQPPGTDRHPLHPLTGIPWEKFPMEMGCASGMTCWQRLRDWTQAGVWPKTHLAFLSHLREADKINWSRAVINPASVRAVFGGPKPARTPRIGARTAASIMSSPMPMASPWRQGQLRPKSTMFTGWSRW